MEVRIHVEPTEVGASYTELVRAARAAEDGGFDGFFRSDHYLPFGHRTGPAGPSDAWTTLGGLARDTRSIRLGTLVSPVTFRSPGPLAIQVADVDEMAGGGRVELGLGAGWHGREHTAYGIGLPARRFSLLAEQVELVTGLWQATGPFTFHSEHYHLDAAPPVRRDPARPVPPLIIGGMGAHRTPALAARYAAEYNALAASPEVAGGRYDLVAKLAAEAGRPAGAIAFSALQTVCCGRTDAEVARRAAALGEPLDPDAFAGSPDAVADQIHRYAEAGATRVYLRLLDLGDLDQLDLLAAAVLPQLTA